MKRALIAVAIVVVAIPVVAIGAASVWLDGDVIKARLADQVQRATGRTLTIAGPVSLAWSLSPTLVLNDVSLSNPPGFSQPRMVHVDRIEARIGLGQLLRRRVVIERVALVAPAIALERDAAGRPNWILAPPQPAAAPATSATAEHGERFALSVGAVEIADATIKWSLQTITVPHLAYDSATGAASGTIEANGAALALSGTVGPLNAATVPVDLHLTGTGVTAGMLGTSATAVLTVSTTDLTALSPLVGVPLPSIRDVSVATTLPGPSAIEIRTGSATMGRFAVGGATLIAASLTDPAAMTAHATLGALPLVLTGHLGSIAGLLRGPVPVDVRAEAPTLTMTASGTMATTGLGALNLELTSPDLRVAGQQAGLTLPALHSLQATGQLGLQSGTADLTGLHLTSTQGDLEGDLSLHYAGRRSLRGTLTSHEFDLQAFTPPAAVPSASPATTTVAPPPPQPSRVIPDTALPLDALRAADADVTMAAAALHWAGVTYSNVSAKAVLANGTLRLDPVSMTLGSTTVHATLQVDAAATPPVVHATIDAPALPFGAVLALVGGTGGSPGTLDVRADLTGSGTTVRALASTLSGRAGLALVDAQVDNALLERLAAGSLRAAGISFDEAGNTAVRCAAVAADAAAGQVHFAALTLDTTRLALDGSGAIDLGTEALDLHVRPELRLGGGLSVPIRVRGTMATPKAQLDPGAFASGRVGIVLGGPPPPDRCEPALATAREGQAGPAAAAPPPVRKLKPADLLRGLLR